MSSYVAALENTYTSSVQVGTSQNLSQNACHAPLSKLDMNVLSTVLSTTDGELHLADGEVFVLEKYNYHFTDIVMEAGSILIASDELNNEQTGIRIVAEDSCVLNGEIALSGFNVELSCGILILSGETHHSQNGSQNQTLELDGNASLQSGVILIDRSSATGNQIINIEGAGDIFVFNGGDGDVFSIDSSDLSHVQIEGDNTITLGGTVDSNTLVGESGDFSVDEICSP